MKKVYNGLLKCDNFDNNMFDPNLIIISFFNEII